MLEIPKIADQSLQSNINRSIIFNFLREKGPTSRAEIAKTLQISPSAVSRVIDNLIKEKFVVETEKVKTAVGKRPILLQINGQKGTIVGIDLSQERFQIALFDFSGKMLTKGKGYKIDGVENEAELVCKETDRFIEAYCLENEITFDEMNLQAISLGIPADIDFDTGEITSGSLYKNWNSINFKMELEIRYKVPVYVEKDVTLSVLASKNHGHGKDFHSIVFVEISSGVSAAIIMDDHLIRGATGSAGQIAFSVIDPDNIGFQSGNMGYLDRYASINSIKERVVKGIEQGQKTMISEMINGDLSRLETYHICEAYLQNDYLAVDSINEVVRLLSIAMVNLTTIINPEIVVLGGNIANLPEVERIFVNPIRDFVSEGIPSKVPVFKTSSLGEDVVLIGASYMAINSVIAGVFPYRIGE